MFTISDCKTRRNLQSNRCQRRQIEKIKILPQSLSFSFSSAPALLAAAPLAARAHLSHIATLATLEKERDCSQSNAVTVNYQELERVDSVKLLGVTIINTLQWNWHVLDVIQKVNKRIYFLKLLKRANVPAPDVICFYLICIRPVLEYCAPLYHHALPDYLTKDIERVQKRALSIISI